MSMNAQDTPVQIISSVKTLWGVTIVFARKDLPLLETAAKVIRCYDNKLSTSKTLDEIVVVILK